MKFKLLIGFFVGASMLILTFASHSFAEGWAPGSCTIDRVGAADSYNFVFVTCPTAGYSNQWFRLDNTNRKELLAVLLTAYSLESNIQVYVLGDGSTIARIRLVD
jgi:hypothetical protein